jgi:hypothetical protein
MGWQGNSLLIYANGTMQLINVESGGLGEAWEVKAQFSAAPIVIGNTLVFPSNNGLVAIAANRRDILWQLADVPPYKRAFVASNGAIALISENDELLYIASDGNLITRTQLRAAGSFASAPNGALLVYTLGGLWQIDPTREWSLYIEDAPAGGDSGAMLSTNNHLFVFDGEDLQAYDQNKQPLWRSAVPLVEGRVELTQIDDLLLLISNGGNIAVLTDEGQFCNQVRIRGNVEARLWYELGGDGILRVAVADQIIGLNWDLFTRPCRI